MNIPLDARTKEQLVALREYLRDYRRMQIAVLSTLAVIGLLFWYWLSEDIRKNRNRMAGEGERMALLEEIGKLQRVIDECQPYLPADDSVDVPWWMDQLTSLAERSEITVERITPVFTDGKVGKYSVIQFVVNVVGHYQGLVAFVHEIEQFKPFIRLDKLDLEETPQEERRAVINISALLSAER